MDIRFDGRPAYTVAYVYLDADEEILVERDAMCAMSDGVEVGAGFGSGGVVGAGLRKTFGGESFFVGRYTARIHGAWVALSPPLPGDVAAVELAPGRQLAIEQGAYLASTPGVDIDAKWAGVKNIMLREGATVLHATGTGTVLFGSYGALQHFTLGDGQSMIVDAGHLVAWDDRMRIQVGMLGGAVKTAATGEGLVARLTGPGEVWMQTRKEQQLASLLMPHRNQNQG